MKLSSQELVEEFYESIKEEYPDLTFEQVKDVCYGPWRYLRTEMEAGHLPVVRFKYFGKFLVNEGTAKGKLRELEEDYKAGKFTDERYIELKTMLVNYLKDEKK